MDLSKEIGKNLGSSLNSVIDECLKRATDEADKKVKKLMEDAVSTMKVIDESRPILKIQINSGSIKKLKHRASPVLPELLLNAELGIMSLMVGPAGCGKTTAAAQVAESLGLQFGSICLTAGASETWLFGRQTPSGFVEGSFSKIYKEGGVFLADEMDAADANLLLSINTALSHDEMFNPMSGETIKKHDKFIFIGAANTNGKGANHLYTGRSRLDAATLDRFVTIFVDYDEKLERELCDNLKFSDYLHRLRRAMREQGFDEFISTRAFAMANKKLKANVSPAKIADSIAANWGDPAKDLSEKTFERSYGHGKKSKGANEGYLSLEALTTSALADHLKNMEKTWGKLTDSKAGHAVKPPWDK